MCISHIKFAHRLLTISLRPSGILRSCKTRDSIARMSTSVVSTIEEVLRVYAPVCTHFPGTVLSQYLVIGLHCNMHASGKARFDHDRSPKTAVVPFTLRSEFDQRQEKGGLNKI